MKQFVTAVEDVVEEDARQEKIDALVAERKDRVTALVEEARTKAAEREVDFDSEAEAKAREAAEAKVRADAEDEVDNGVPVEFELDGRVMRAYPPADGQLALLLASLGRGQKKEGRFAAILNVMFESMNEDDKDYLEARMMTRKKEEKIPMKQIEAIFEYLVEEWFR